MQCNGNYILQNIVMFRPVEINLRAEMKNMVEMSSIGRAKTKKT